MFNFNPKEDKFYNMFVKSAKNVNEAAIILRENLDSLGDRNIDLNKTEKLEVNGDELVRDIIRELNEAFITPIDREDIYAIVKKMDDILDLINSTMHRFIMFNINKCTTESQFLCDIIVQATGELVELMEELKLIGSKSNKINSKIEKINQLEDSADMLFRETVAELFKNEADPLVVMKWKEIYQILENTIDTCETVANIVEGVVIKNA